MTSSIPPPPLPPPSQPATVTTTATTRPASHDRVERIVWVIVSMIVFFCTMMFVAKVFFDDPTIIAIFSTMVSGYGGALLLYIKTNAVSSTDRVTSRVETAN